MYDPKQVFTDDQLRQIRILGASIRNNIIPIQYKDFFFFGNGQMWDIDTYTAECCQCLSMTENDYEHYRWLHRLDEITVNIDLMKRICYTYKVPSFLKLKEISGHAQTIIICEAGRGIDVLLASFVKPWEEIIAYDQDKGVLHEMNKHFKGELGLPFRPLQLCSVNYNFVGINDNAIVFGTCHNVSAEKKTEILSNGCLKGIFDGEFLNGDSLRSNG